MVSPYKMFTTKLYISGPNLYIVLVPDQMPDFNTVTIQSNPSLQPHIQGINLQSVPPNIWNQISAVTGLTSFGNANFPFPANTGSTNGNFPFAANTAPTFGSIYPGAQFANPCLVSFGNPANTFGGPAPIASMYTLHKWVNYRHFYDISL